MTAKATTLEISAASLGVILPAPTAFITSDMTSAASHALLIGRKRGQGQR